MYSRQQIFFFLYEISNEGKFTFWFCVLFFCLYKETQEYRRGRKGGT